MSAAALLLSTEAALLAAVAPRGAPVPEVVHVCRPADGLGEAYVMRRLEGETLGKRIVRDEAFAGVRSVWPGAAERCWRRSTPRRWTACRPWPCLDAASELARYEEVYRQSARRPVFEAAFRWLADRAPPWSGRCWCTATFATAISMISPQAGLVGVLDWERVDLGDPAEDQLDVRQFLAVRRVAPARRVGSATTRTCWTAHAAAGGAAVSLERLLFWQALGSLEMGRHVPNDVRKLLRRGGPPIERAMIGRRASETEIDLVLWMEAAA